MRDIDFDATPPKGYWRNARGDLVHAANITENDRDADAVVQKIHGFGADLAAQMWRFRTYSMDDVAGFVARLLERTGAAGRSTRGNVTLTSFDGRLKVTLTIAEYVSIGPEIIAAQALMEECLERWTRGASPEVKALIEQAFTPNAEGQLSVTALLRLRRIAIDDPKWRAMQHAIADAMRPGGTAEYIRLYRRDHPAQPWVRMSLHLANVAAAPAETGETTPRARLERRVRSAIDEARRAGMGEGAIRETLLAAKRRETPAADEGADGA